MIEVIGIVCLVVVAIVGAVIFLRERYAVAALAPVDPFESFARVSVSVPHFSYVDGKQNGIILNCRDRTLSFRRSDAMAQYKYGDVREWRIHNVSGGAFYGLGAAAAIGAAIGSAMVAASTSGLFVRVRDINNPEWFVNMSSRDDQNRWFEILTQELNEGGVQAIPPARSAGFCGACGAPVRSPGTRFCTGCGGSI